MERLTFSYKAIIKPFHKIIVKTNRKPLFEKWSVFNIVLSNLLRGARCETCTKCFLVQQSVEKFLIFFWRHNQ